ncbi:MAG: GlsB/YeaQ/YmgE family stress response membrane protein [Gaiellaceae bacterium]
MHWVWLIIVGLIVGALGRLLHPGKDPLGWILTLVLGVVSLIIAGLIFSSGVLEFVVGIIIAAVLLAIWARLAPRAAH